MNNILRKYRHYIYIKQDNLYFFVGYRVDNICIGQDLCWFIKMKNKT